VTAPHARHGGRATVSRFLPRVIGVVLLLLVVAVALLLWFVVAPGTEADADPLASRVVLGVWRVLYDTQAPSLAVATSAVAVALLAAALVAVVENRAATRARTSYRVTSRPLAARVVMAETRGVYAGPVTVTVLVPAHDEAAILPDTLRSLRAQSPAPQRVVVVADNCTDDTVAVARAHGCEVFETVGNTQKKAGALNQALREILPGLGDNDAVLVMDADTQLDPGFLAAAVRRMTDDRALMAVGGVFSGEPGHGLLGMLQRNEYTRYGRDIARRRGRVFVLTGTASLFRPRALRAVAAARGHAIPGTPGDVYDTAALTEDNELTIALKSLGALMVSPAECTVVTELMPTWRALWAQRLRWQRGALENIGAYGLTAQTFRYWQQQFALGYGGVALTSYFVLGIITLLAIDQWVWFPFWLGLGAIFTLERVVTAWRGGWPARLLAVTLLPELVFAMFLNLVYLRAVVDITLGRQGTWNHVQHARREPAGAGPAPVRAPEPAPVTAGA
jgi:cellulose synthase/poly-beta-1,6-N-acetylglucosamine synthase-like glycosyltransferase